MSYESVGSYDPHFKLRGEYAVDDLQQLPCTKDSGHCGARQIFPLLKHPNWRTPTVKHSCPRVIMAASIRAVSNKVEPDPKMFEQFSEWCEKFYFPEILSCFDHELCVVDFSSWLNDGRYTIPYRKQIDNGMKWENRNADPTFPLKSFPKIEMQHTTVVHELKQTILNDSKEREICGPSAEHKGIVNAFCNKLEEIFDRYLKGFCCRKNWMQICESIEKFREVIVDGIDGAGDQSMFDTSQKSQFNLLMNRLIKKILEHPNVIINQPLTPEDIMEGFDKSVFLKVMADFGKILYNKDNRASGHGWTMLLNSILNLGYWKFTYYLANIKQYWVTIKSDDSLFGHSRADHERFLAAVDKVFTRSKEPQVHGLGQICKRLDFGDITDLEFLSNHFFWTEKGRLRMTRIPERIIQTLSWTTNIPSNLKGDELLLCRRNLCFSKGMSMLAWGTGLPIWQVLGEKMVELGVNGKYTDFCQYRDKSRKWQPRDDKDAYLIYLSKFGINSGMVESIESRIKKIKEISGVVEIPEFELFYSE